MENIQLSIDDKKFLLELARRSIIDKINGKHTVIQSNEIPSHLTNNGACFVTLKKWDQLRGCIGTLEAYQPLVQDVVEHAAAAAFEDYRFRPVKEEEVPELEIEISYLTPLERMEYSDEDDLLKKIVPHEDGLVLRDGGRRATFLPQVWEQLPEKREFLNHLCSKMGMPPDLWRKKHLDVYTYRVVSFSEEEFR